MATLTATGRLGRDAELRTVGDKKVASFSIAYETGYGDKKQTHWVDCAYWRGEKIVSYLIKGALVEISGEPSVRTYESKGGTKAVMQVRVDSLKLHGGKREDRPVADNARATAGDSLDDDLPF